MLFILTVDGTENSNEKISFGEIKQLILDQKEHGREFVFRSAKQTSTQSKWRATSESTPVVPSTTTPTVTEPVIGSERADIPQVPLSPRPWVSSATTRDENPATKTSKKSKCELTNCNFALANGS